HFPIPDTPSLQCCFLRCSLGSLAGSGLDLVISIENVFVKKITKRVHGFTLMNGHMRCWAFTRSGGVVSPQFRLSTGEGKQLLRRIVVGYQMQSDLGLACGPGNMPTQLDRGVWQCTAHGLPGGESLRKKFTFISTSDGEKLKNERVIINDFGTPMGLAIINP
ncbi:hypothetical protein FN846DRAFT_3950, partial [Sphaerosporella brunnea]